MMIRGSAAGIFAGGVMLWIFSKIIPLLGLMLMDWVAVFMMCGGIFILLFVFPISNTGLLYDSIPPGTAVIEYIRRDGNIVQLLGKRIFAGESFLDVPKLGLIEDLGKDTVFLWGRKKVRFGLENINYTPNPKHFNMCKTLYDMGFDDSDDLEAVLNLDKMDPVRQRVMKAYYLERMGNIYWYMTHEPPRGASRLLSIFGKHKQNNTVFGRKRHDQPSISEPEPTKKNDRTIEEMNEWLRLRR